MPTDPVFFAECGPFVRGGAAHTRARETVHKLEVEVQAIQTRHETKQLELKNELDRHSRDRSQLLEDHNQKLDEIHLTNTAVVRLFFGCGGVVWWWLVVGGGWWWCCLVVELFVVVCCLVGCCFVVLVLFCGCVGVV